jgi:type IV pilus assembly protein PilY1
MSEKKKTGKRLSLFVMVVTVVTFLLTGRAQATNLAVTKTVDDTTPAVGETVTFTIVVENLEDDEESAGTILSDDLSLFENVQYRFRESGWSGRWSWDPLGYYYYYVTGSFSSWADWPGSGQVSLGSLDQWRNWWISDDPAGGRYEFEIRATVPSNLSGQEITNTATVEKNGFTNSASTSVYVEGEPWTGGETFTPFLKPLPSLYDTNVQPNVLLLVDTSGSMTFNMTDDNTTHGDGSKPVDYGFDDTQFYYGWDTDSANNDPGAEHNYHPALKYIPQSEIDLVKAKQGSGALGWLGGPHPNDDPPTGYSDYKYPNDSRMYQTKLVLNEIFSDQQLVSGLRVALSTYDQNDSDSGTPADWYKFYRGSYVIERQNLHYSTGSAKADLRVPFNSTDNPSHVAEVLSWFDGTEAEGNPELRAQGGTPLAASIYGARSSGWSWTWDKDVNSAVKFFREDGVIQAWCQRNYLIVLTDGADTDIGNPVEAVKKLYDEAETGDWPEYFGRKSLPVKTLVIGLIDPDEMDDLADTLNEMADYGWDGEEGNVDPSDDPFESGDPGAYFAENLDELLAAFRNIFALIQADQTTGGAPMVSPARTETADSSVYVTSFLPQNFRQWKGHFYRFNITEEGMEDSYEWDAAVSLNNRSLNNRLICTIDWEGSTGATPVEFDDETNFVSFNSSAASTFADEMAPEGYIIPSLFLDKFIDWVRGYDEWHESPGSERRYIFPDIYHGGVTEVGVPSASYPSATYAEFANDNKDRQKLLYFQSNSGMLHAIDPESDGFEKWAFIPPNILARGRLLGLKAYFENWGSVNLLDETPSVPRYLLDGPLVAEDVVLSGGWSTVLFGCLGYGGQGMYALDVTNPDDPVFLWAVENNIVSPDDSSVLPEDKRKIHYWQKDTTVKVQHTSYAHEDVNEEHELDYRALYKTLSTPVIAYARSVAYDNDLWEGRWIAAMGNGHPGKFDGTFSEGFVYFIDIENGEILKKLKAEDNSGDNILKPICAPVSGFSSSIASRVLDYLYAADTGGNVFQWTADDHWENHMQIYEAPEDESGITYRMDVGMVDGERWLFYQTGDMENLTYSGTAFRLYALNTEEAYYDDPLEINDLQEISPTGGTSSNEAGWYMTFATNPAEIPSTPVTFYNGYLLFATFAESDDPCELGDSRIYAMEAKTGKGGWNNDSKFLELPGLHITGITVFDDKVYFGVVGFATEQDVQDVLGQSAVLANNLLSFDLPDEIPSGDEPGQGANTGVIFWKEWRDEQ